MAHASCTCCAQCSDGHGGCNGWVHLECVNLTPEEAANVDNYVCPMCIAAHVAPHRGVSVARGGTVAVGHKRTQHDAGLSDSDGGDSQNDSGMGSYDDASFGSGGSYGDFDGEGDIDV